jgi:ABC-type polysaccharide/polyol phosphate transport system ATPase subunit
MTPAIEFEGVWKKFRYGVVHDSLRDLIPAMARRLVGRGPRRDELAASDFWALRDVSFSVRPGEALGIVGPNGSGKSTALKLLTRVLGPTRGRCRILGRAGALIELSAGFHPDLTGRENVFLQGAVMGMRRPEIARKFDQIVEFAGVEKFIDTPVKRYSSGMTARLGFAIAAHLDPEVLIIDEVLAVGDTAFQRKALGRVEQLVRSGIPVVIVTHQLDQVTALCTKALLLEYGSAVAMGTPSEVVTTYLERSMQQKIVSAAAMVVEKMELWKGTTAVSGGRLPIGLQIVVRDRARVDEHRLGIRVRAVATGTTLFETALEDGDAPLPSRSSWFWLAASLQFNVAPGAYYVEIVVRQRIDGREVGSGPGAYVDVEPGHPFDGTVQMNATYEITHAEEFPAEHDHAAPGHERAR